MKLEEIDLSDFRLLNIYAESWEIVEVAYQHFTRLHSKNPTHLEIAGTARPPRSTWKRIFNIDQTCVSWLAKDAQISIERAMEIIDGFPIPVARRLDAAALNPRRFLGLASAMHRAPDSIVFSTSGMDPSGFISMHQYAMSHFSGTLIHLDVLRCECCRPHGTVIEIDAQLRIIAR